MKDKENQKIIDAYDYLSNAASSQDCTGLIPSEPISTAELESYEELYQTGRTHQIIPHILIKNGVCSYAYSKSGSYKRYHPKYPGIQRRLLRTTGYHP